MKKQHLILLPLLLIISCVSRQTNTANQLEIASATQRLGEEYYNAGKYTPALKKLLEAYETIPDDPYLNNSLGLVYLVKERYQLAEKHFKTALTLKPDYVHARNNLGAAFLKQKKWDLAIASFTEVADNILYGTPERPLSNLGWAYLHQKKYSQSAFYFQKALDAHPNFLVAIHGLASIYNQTGFYAKTIEFLHHQLKENPSAAVLHADLAKAYEGRRNREQAIKSWELVLSLVPTGSPLAKEAYERLAILK